MAPVAMAEAMAQEAMAAEVMAAEVMERVSVTATSDGISAWAAL
jgi:hypothetical protein